MSTSKETIDPSEFMAASVSAVRGLGRKGEVDLVFQGNEAKTDGNTIYVPSIPLDKPLDGDTAAIMRGYIDHECGHVRHTNMDYYGNAVLDAAEKGNTLYGAVLNAIEDVRTEDCVIAEYPGVRKNLEAVHEAAFKQILKEINKRSAAELENWKVLAAVAICAEANKRRGMEAPKKVMAAIPDDLRKQAELWCDALDGIRRTVAGPDGQLDGKRGTIDAIELANTIVGEVYDHTKEPKPEKVVARAGGGGGGGTYKMSPAKGPSGGKAIGGGVGGGGGSIEEGSGGKFDPIKTSFDPVKLEHTKGELERTYVPATTKYDVTYTRHSKHKIGREMAAAGNVSEYERMSRGMDGKITVMSRKLTLALQEKLKRGWTPMRDSGRFDRKRLVAAYQGKQNIYRQRDPIPALDSCVQLIVDLSGSMCGYKVSLATQAAIVMAEALDRTGVPFEICGFTRRRSLSSVDPDLDDEVRKSGMKWGRISPIDQLVFKSFEEPLRAVRGCVASMIPICGGDNCDGESIAILWQRMAKRPEKKKALIVLSDGYPATDSANPKGLYRHEERHCVNPGAGQGVRHRHPERCREAVLSELGTARRHRAAAANRAR